MTIGPVFDSSKRMKDMRYRMEQLLYLIDRRKLELGKLEFNKVGLDDVVLKDVTIQIHYRELDKLAGMLLRIGRNK